MWLGAVSGLDVSDWSTCEVVQDHVVRQAL